MSKAEVSLETIENETESKLYSLETNESIEVYKKELLTLICDKTFHSAKLMRLYTEVLLQENKLEHAYASFDTYVSLQTLSLIKLKSGTRSVTDPFIEGTCDIFKKMLLMLENQGYHSGSRIFKLGKQLADILDELPDKESPDTLLQVAPIFARVAVAKIIASEEDISYQKSLDEAHIWFEKVGPEVDAETDYARGVYQAIVSGPAKAYKFVKDSLKKSPQHIRSALLLVQLLSAEHQLAAALEIANIYLSRKPTASSIVDKLAFIRLKKSQIAMIEIINGSEAALGELPEFIELVSLLFALPKNDKQQPQTLNNNDTPVKPTRRIFSFKRTSTNASTASHVSTPSTSVVSGKELAEIDSRIIAFSWFWIAQQYVKVGLETEAREAITEGKSYLPTADDLNGCAQIQALVGQVEHENNPKRALKHYMQALEIMPLNPCAAIGAALILTSANEGLFNKELATSLTGTLGSVCQKLPGRFVPEAWYARGLLYEKLGVDIEARKMYWKAIEIEERRGVTGYLISIDATLS